MSFWHESKKGRVKINIQNWDKYGGIRRWQDKVKVTTKQKNIGNHVRTVGDLHHSTERCGSQPHTLSASSHHLQCGHMDGGSCWTPHEPVQSPGRNQEKKVSTVVEECQSAVQQPRCCHQSKMAERKRAAGAVKADVYALVDSPRVVTLRVEGQLKVAAGTHSVSLHHPWALSSCNTEVILAQTPGVTTLAKDQASFISLSLSGYREVLESKRTEEEVLLVGWGITVVMAKL